MGGIPVMLKIREAAEKFDLSEHYCRRLVLETLNHLEFPQIVIKK